MIQLINYSKKFEKETVRRITEFFKYHSNLLTEKEGTFKDDQAAKNILKGWMNKKHELFIIQYGSKNVGFLHLCYKSSTVVWIEDIFVDEPYRVKGIASSAILKVEEYVKDKKNYHSICMDVIPRNEAALKLYHKLGFDSISLVLNNSY